MENKLSLLVEPLTLMQKTFCEKYVVHLNGTKAALEAGYSDKNPHVQASQLMTNENVKKYIQWLRQQQMENMGVSKDRVLLELCRMAYVDIGELYDEMGCIKNPADMPEDVRRAISSIESKELFEQDGKKKKYIGDAKKVRLTPKEKALEMLARHVGLFEADNLQKRDITVVVTGEESADIWRQLNFEF